MRILFMILFINVTFLAFGQLYVKDGGIINLNDSLTWVTVEQTAMSQTLTVYYYKEGNRLGAFSEAVNQKGDKIRFISMGAIIEYMWRCGWEYVEHMDSGHILFKKLAQK